jgi:sigma-B regulation protein RsbU (phosphoserine phosphatase)
MARIDTKANTLTYCNCGHDPGILLRNGQVMDLNEGGLVLGITPDTHYNTQTVPFEQNDCLLMYTDGLIDAMNFDGQMWGRQRLLDVLQNQPATCAEYLVHNILAYRRRFVGLASQTDDTSIVAVRRDLHAHPEGLNCEGES